MGRALNTRLPVLPTVLLPQSPNDAALQARDAEAKAKSQMNYDRHHGARTLKPLNSGTKVFVRGNDKWSKPGVVLSGDTNRTYLVNTDSGVQRRNRVHLLPVPESVSDAPQSMDLPVETPVVALTPQSNATPVQTRVTRLSSGCTIRKPTRYRDD